MSTNEELKSLVYQEAAQQPDMSGVERLLDGYAFWVQCYQRGAVWPQDVEHARTTLLDYVRGIMAERDALIAAHAGDTKKMAEVERQLFESWIVRECGPGASKRWLNTDAYENMRVNDYRTGWVACLGLISATTQPVGKLPIPEVVEELAVTRYRPVPNGLFGYKVVAGDGSRTIFEGTKRECGAIARKLTEAFLDGAFVGGEQCRAAGYAAGVAAVRDYAVQRWKAEVDMRPLENKHRRTLDDVWRQVIAHTGGDPVALIGPCHDALVALRGEVKS